MQDNRCDIMLAARNGMRSATQETDMYAEVSNPIPSTTVVADEDEPSYSVDEWHDCQQEDDAVSAPNDDVTASNSSASSNPL